MTDEDNYPMGAKDDPRAPWNEQINTDKEIEVEVTVTLKKKLKILVDDYDVLDSGLDEDGNYYEDIDYSECNLVDAVKSQHILPQEAADYITTNTNRGRKSFYDLRDWKLDDIDIDLT